SRHNENSVDIVLPGERSDAVPLEPVTESNTVLNQDSVTFDVDRVGVPMLVKVRYFPDWKVDGAEGPYRVVPNFMVVVPTSTHVELRYHVRNMTDWLAYGATLIGLGLLVVMWRKGPTRFRGAALATDD